MGYKSKGGIALDDTVADGTLTSPSINIEQCEGIAFNINITGASLAGTYTIQASLDGINWLDTTETAALTASGDNLLINMSDLYYPFIRIAITSTNANVATVLVKYHMKGI